MQARVLWRNIPLMDFTFVSQKKDSLCNLQRVFNKNIQKINQNNFYRFECYGTTRLANWNLTICFWSFPRLESSSIRPFASSGLSSNWRNIFWLFLHRWRRSFKRRYKPSSFSTLLAGLMEWYKQFILLLKVIVSSDNHQNKFEH
jgi:hypothetical protein